MSQKKQRSKRKQNGIEVQTLRERFTSSETRKNEPTSAYWNFGLHHFGMEDPKGNPDQLAETDALYQSPQPLTEAQEAQVEAYHRLVAHKGFRFLTDKEKEIWRLLFEEWKEPPEIAKILNMSTSAVHSAIKRVGKKIKKLILEDLEDEKELRKDVNKLA